MIGVLSSPETERAEAPAVLLINSGLIHRVGPNRLYVTIARELAKRGFYGLRFDLSGVGDSRMPSSRDGLSIPDRAQSDILSATQAVREAVGVDRFVVMGLCSGAFMAHRAAMTNEQVVGCAQFDGHVYPTRGFYLRHYGPRLLQPGAWIRFLRRSVKPGQRVPGGPEQDDAFAPDMISKDVFARDVSALIQRDMRLLFVLTRGGLQEVNYARQLHDCVPGVDLDRHAEVLHIPDAHHTLTLGRHRDTVVEVAANWVDRSFL